MKVLIVEDSLVMRRLLRSSLQKWQYEVTEAEDGAQAWELFQHEHFPLVLTDWLMPEMDGLELTRRIRECELPQLRLHHPAHGEIRKGRPGDGDGCRRR